MGVQWEKPTVWALIADVSAFSMMMTEEKEKNMKELELKYGCNPNQKPARVFMQEGGLPFQTDLPDPFPGNRVISQFRAVIQQKGCSIRELRLCLLTDSGLYADFS